MLKTAILNTDVAKTPDSQTRTRAILKMQRNDRMAGSVPVWEKQSTAKDKVIERLAYATPASQGQFEKALAYAEADTYQNSHDKPFGFGDLVDMVNPLQHIPLVSSVYREVSGDEIRPVSRIIGGAVFGGPVGAASGIVNVLVENETGQDIASNLMSFVQKPDISKPDITSPFPGNKEDRSEPENEDLPGTVVRYADLGGGRHKVFKQVTHADSRMAGSITHIYTETTPLSVSDKQGKTRSQT